MTRSRRPSWVRWRRSIIRRRRPPRWRKAVREPVPHVWTPARAEHEDCAAAVGERVDELDRERGLAAGRIPDGVLTVFEEVADLTEGQTLAPVIELSKKDRDYTCGSCHVTLPYHLVVNLHSNGAGVQQCPNCRPHSPSRGGRGGSGKSERRVQATSPTRSTRATVLKRRPPRRAGGFVVGFRRSRAGRDHPHRARSDDRSHATA